MRVHEQLVAILTADYNLPPEVIQPDAPLESLGLDSLGMMELLFKLEDTFHISIPTEQTGMRTVAELEAYLTGLIAQKTADAHPASAAAGVEGNTE